MNETDHGPRVRRSLWRAALAAMVGLIGLGELYELVGPLAYPLADTFERDHLARALAGVPGTLLYTLVLVAAVLRYSRLTAYIQGAAIALAASEAFGMLLSLYYMSLGSTAGPLRTVGFALLGSRLLVAVAIVTTVILDVRSEPE